MRPRLSPEDQDLGRSATLYCYREQSGGGGSTEVLPSADVPEGEKPLKAKAKARKVGQLNLREEDVVMKTVNELKTDVRLPDGFTRGNNHATLRARSGLGLSASIASGGKTLASLSLSLGPEPEPDNYFYHRDRSIGLPRTP